MFQLDPEATALLH